MGISRYVFEQNDVDLLSRFRNRTILTITTDRNRGVYQNQIIDIAPQVCARKSLAFEAALTPHDSIPF